MGKKAKSSKGALRAKERKLDKSTLPPPPKPVTDEVGSAKLLDEPSLPGSGYKALNQEGYDDGGVADLTLVIDLDDSVLRRKRGETDYFQALKADLLPRVTKGSLAHLPRREQKIKLAKLLFSDEEHDEDKNPSEVWQDTVDGNEDAATKKLRQERLASARMALSLSSVLREPACASLSLSEISKRRLSLYGKEGAEDALRCADKAIEIAGPGFWDRDEIEIEAEESPKIDEKYEKNATAPGLSNEVSLKLQPVRVSQLCLRSAYLHRGNALAALGREDEARETYQKVLPMLEAEPRCGRLDWERCSILVNIGNTFSRQGDYDKANEQYTAAEKLGRDHIEADEGNKVDGMGIAIVSMRARAFALKKAGREEDGKNVLKDVIKMQIELNAENEKKKAEEKEAEEKARAESAAKENSNTAANPAVVEN
ncbi:tetratricopeptide repeat protein [Nitzschia inconspicua]|uniref:Tetratricopeptide repeat protein n=1 Tax=Nitzschia inconspicua TaxID=303405 RepID=A0A9K3LCI3_9STRA|nr:tetratricopeptide repeat protein [Nitzschia inconspicua]